MSLEAFAFSLSRANPASILTIIGSFCFKDARKATS